MKSIREEKSISIRRRQSINLAYNRICFGYEVSMTARKYRRLAAAKRSKRKEDLFGEETRKEKG
jgi:hypothetical protein